MIGLRVAMTAFSSGGGGGGSYGEFSVNGQRSNSNYFTVDGVRATGFIVSV